MRCSRDTGDKLFAASHRCCDVRLCTTGPYADSPEAPRGNCNGGTTGMVLLAAEISKRALSITRDDFASDATSPGLGSKSCASWLTLPVGSGPNEKGSNADASATRAGTEGALRSSTGMASMHERNGSKCSAADPLPALGDLAGWSSTSSSMGANACAAPSTCGSCSSSRALFSAGGAPSSGACAGSNTPDELPSEAPVCPEEAMLGTGETADDNESCCTATIAADSPWDKWLPAVPVGPALQHSTESSTGTFAMFCCPTCDWLIAGRGCSCSCLCICFVLGFDDDALLSMIAAGSLKYLVRQPDNATKKKQTSAQAIKGRDKALDTKNCVY